MGIKIGVGDKIRVGYPEMKVELFGGRAYTFGIVLSVHVNWCDTTTVTYKNEYTKEIMDTSDIGRITVIERKKHATI